jgi:hypothetical protein
MANKTNNHYDVSFTSAIQEFMKFKYRLEDLNQIFSIDVYLTCSESERMEFRLALIDCVKNLRRRKYKVGIMRPEDVLSTGLKQDNKTALAISILQQKMKGAGYDELFYFRDTIRILKRQLLKELFGEKNIFYFLADRRINYDPNYVPFILGPGIVELEPKRKRNK